MEHRIAAQPAATRSRIETDWVRETSFGRWFLRTGIWRRYVLAEALDTLTALAGERLRPGGHVLDIGCGEGSAVALLDGRWQPRRITGVDIDGALIGRARERAADPPLSAELRLEQGRATAIPLPDHSVDMVLCHQLLHHMRAQREALVEMHRVLRPGGLLLLAESCRCFIESWPVRALFRHPRDSQRDAAGYLALVRSAGFRLADGDIVTESPWWSLPDLGLRRRLGRRAPAGGEPTEVLAVAEKPA